MKKIVFIILILSNCGVVFAQDCIPNPVYYSKSIINRLRYKTKDSLAGNILTWNDVAPIYDSLLADSAKAIKKDGKVPSRADAKNDIEIKLIKELNTNIDSLLARGQRFGINWAQISFKNDASRITKEKNLPASLWFDDGKLQFSFGDSLYELSCQALLINNEWKLAGISSDINVYDKNGTALGVMYSSYEDFSKPTTDSTEMIMDSIMKSQSKPVVKKRKTPVRKKTTSSTTKQAIKKPDTN
jgi:hypothetical protein